MRSSLIIIGIILGIVIVAVGVWFFIFYKNTQQPINNTSTNTISSLPTAPSTTAVQSQSASPMQQEVATAFTGQTTLKPNLFTLGNTIIVAPYALQVWQTNTEGGGGAALLYDDPSKGWELLSTGAGAWDVPSLVNKGVPQAIAAQLVAGL